MPEKSTKWTVVGAGEKPGFLLCRCACGAMREVNRHNIRLGLSRSCGCQRGVSLTKHGKLDSPEYRVWARMKSRCLKKDHPRYMDYGGRGVAVCSRWADSFAAFYADMGPRPSPKHSLDRFPDNDGNYEPGNCRWATSSEQARNTRKTLIYTDAGRTMRLRDWASELGMSYSVLLARIGRLGWDFKDAISKPVRPCRRG